MTWRGLVPAFRGRRGLVPASLLAAVPALAAAEGWEAPAAEKARANPVPVSRNALQRGRALYRKHCVSCHGGLGKGDGPAAGYRSGSPADLTQPDLRQVTDGEIFWKVSTGLKDDTEVLMPAFVKDMPDEQDRWKVILFVRTLGAP